MVSPVRTVTICSSSKFYESARRAAAALTSAGLTVYTPRFDYNEELVSVTESQKIQLTKEFLSKIDKSDAIFVVAKGGYTGPSVCIEVGYATAQHKQVIFSEPPQEAALRALVTEVVPIEEVGTGLQTCKCGASRPS